MLQLKSIFYVFEGATFNYYLINKYHTKMYIYPETDKKLYWIRKFYDNPIFQEVTWDYIKNTDNTILNLNGISLNLQSDSNGSTALHLACQYDILEMVLLLILKKEEVQIDLLNFKGLKAIDLTNNIAIKKKLN